MNIGKNPQITLINIRDYVAQSVGSVLRSILIVLLLLVLTIALTYPRILHLNDAVENPGDPLKTCWILAWETHKLTTGMENFFNANTFYPESLTLAHSPHMFGLLPLAAPLIIITGKPLLAYNLLFILNFVLTGIATFALLNYLIDDRTIALLGGILFAFSPFRFAQMGHFSRTFTVWMPLIFLFFHRFLDKRKFVDWLLFVVTFNLQALTRYYHAYPLTFSIGWMIFAWFICKRKLPERGVWIGFVAFGFITAAIHLPIANVYYQVRQQYSVERSPEVVRSLSLHLTDFLSAAPRNRIFGPLTARWRSAHSVERSLFPGIIPVLLAIFGIGVSFLNREMDAQELELRRAQERATPKTGILLYSGMLLLITFLSLGPEVRIPGLGTKLTLPYFWLVRKIPGMAGLRAPAKFMTPFFLALSVVASYGAVYLYQRVLLQAFGLKGFWRLGFIILFAVLAIAEAWAVPGPIYTVNVGSERPYIYKWLEQDEETEVLLELPIREMDIQEIFREARRLFYSTYHWKKMINGYASVVPPSRKEIVREMQDFPDRSSIIKLQSLGVDTVILNGDQFSEKEWRRIWHDLPTFSNDVEVVGCWKGDCALRIRRVAEINLDEPLVQTNYLLGQQIRLIGYRVEPERVEPGQRVHIQLWWQALESMDKSYTVFTHLLSPFDKIQGQHDGKPRRGTYPTELWHPGEVIVDDHYLTVSSEAQKGLYEVQVGIYLLSTMERLPVLSDDTGQNRIVLERIWVR